MQCMLMMLVINCTTSTAVKHAQQFTTFTSGHKA